MLLLAYSSRESYRTSARNTTNLRSVYYTEIIAFELQDSLPCTCIRSYLLEPILKRTQNDTFRIKRQHSHTAEAMHVQIIRASRVLGLSIRLCC
jgi:hypothetical protein